MQCTSLFDTCAEDTEPYAPALGTSLSVANGDCVPLICAPLWNITRARTACSGCPLGSSGAFHSCTPCGPGELCPGLLPLPLALPLALISRPTGPAAPDRCSTAAALNSLGRTSALGLEAEAVTGALSGLPLWLSMAMAGFFGLVLLVYCSSVRFKNVRCLQRLQVRFRGCDMCKIATMQQGIADVQSRATALGGFFTLLAAVTLMGLVAMLLSGFALNNDVANTAPDSIVGQLDGVLEKFPWAGPLPKAAALLRPPLPPRVVLQLRLIGQEGLGCRLPTGRSSALFSAPPGEEAMWKLDSAPAGLGCDAPFAPPAAPAASAPPATDALSPTASSAPTGSATAGTRTRTRSPGAASSAGNAAAPPSAAPPLRLSLFTLSCENCLLTSASWLEFNLNFTCQSFVLEAVAVDATGDVRSVQFPVEKSAAFIANSTLLVAVNGTIPVEPRFLATVAWSLIPSLTVIEDEAGSGKRNAAGLRLGLGSASSTFFNPLTDNAGEGVQPLANKIVVRVELPLQTLFFRTTITTKQSTSQLLTGLVGLLGSLGLFAAMFKASKSLRASWMGRCVLGGPSGLTRAGAIAALTAPPVATGAGGERLPRWHANQASAQLPPAAGAVETWRVRRSRWSVKQLSTPQLTAAGHFRPLPLPPSPMPPVSAEAPPPLTAGLAAQRGAVSGLPVFFTSRQREPPG